jgi:hypothetical protein
MKHLKVFEKYKEFYDVDPKKPVVIKDQYLRDVRDVTETLWRNKRDDSEERIKKFRGRPAKMEYQQDDFFTTLYFDDEVFCDVPAHMLINKDKYDIKIAAKKYNI